ncbi:transposase [Rhodovulum sp. MB263]|uniref:transposase n=1 Tax=Rhodovulum sp. (strain MB263) TaxID=308754 RepID=UPI0009B7D1F5|nr:transposase [Rhodovulum sp. MB263]ARC87808.1 hypothetical protein B5V46_03830 [Rhodovulum sp. MB263]
MGTQIFIAGLSTDAPIAPSVIKGAMDGEALAACVEQVPVPELEPDTVVIPDNLATHKNVAAAKAGCWFLPPSSPELNPTEMAFSKFKHSCAGWAHETSLICFKHLQKSGHLR